MLRFHYFQTEKIRKQWSLGREPIKQKMLLPVASCDMYRWKCALYFGNAVATAQEPDI